jgi:hypothetical protein
MLTFLCTHPRTILLIFYALFLLAIELGLRQFWGDELLPNPSVYVVPDSRVHHDYRADISFVTRPYPGDTFPPAHNDINALGMRGPLPGAKKERRILLLGDSFVQADEVAFALTFGQLLNTHFTPRAQFVAHGMVSWAPTPEFSWLYHKGLALEPDEVVLFLCINDFYRPQVFHQTDAVYRQQATYSNSVPVAYQLPAQPLIQNLLDRSALLRLLQRAYRLGTLRLKATMPAADGPTIPAEIKRLEQPPASWPPDLRTNVDTTLKVVFDMHHYLRTHGIALHVTLVPLPFAWPDENAIGKQHPLYAWAADFSVSQLGLKSYLQRELAQRNIPWIDLQTAFATAKSQSETLLFNEVDGHWNAAGHRVVFAALREYFAEALASP